MNPETRNCQVGRFHVVGRSLQTAMSSVIEIDDKNKHQGVVAFILYRKEYVKACEVKDFSFVT